MILVAPYEPNESMCPWIREERFDIPEWLDALFQANGLVIERPYNRGVQLPAWILTKPDA